MIVALLLELTLTDICQNLAAKIMTIVKLKHLQEFFILFKFKLTVSVYLQLFILSIGLIYVFTKTIIFLYKKIKKSITLFFIFYNYIQKIKIDNSFIEIMIQLFLNFIQFIKKLIKNFILNIYILEYYIMVVLGTLFIIFLFIYILYLIYKY